MNKLVFTIRPEGVLAGNTDMGKNSCYGNTRHQNLLSKNHFYEGWSFRYVENSKRPRNEHYVFHNLTCMHV